MAFKPAEVWVGDDHWMIAIRKKGGGYMYFVNTELPVTNNWQRLEDIGAIQQKTAELLVEIVEAKTNERGNRV